MPSKTLYICYFGLREPLVQTQVIPYLKQLIGRRDVGTRERGDLAVQVALLTFEPHAVGEVEEKRLRAELGENGIDWHWLRYHKRPSAIATAYDIFRGTLFVRRFISTDKIDILHGRVHIPTLMGALARRFSRRKPKLLFDIRGFFPEEYTDAGIWPAGGWLYRSAKRVEKWLLKEADGFVVLTEKAREILFPDAAGSTETGFLAANPQSAIRNPQSSSRHVEVIPCCVDLKKFEGLNKTGRAAMRRLLNAAGSKRRILVYVGSFGGWYMSDELFDFYAAARRADPNVYALILTQRQPELAVERIRAVGFETPDYLVTSATPDEIPKYLNASDAAISFIKKCYSKQASSPTKNAEYLAAGLPIIANSGVGDVDSLIEGDGVGVLVDKFDDESYLAALDALTAFGDIGDHCREMAKLRFDLENVGGVRYRRLYARLLTDGSN